MGDQWQKVFIFISSTFNDMHAERDYLVKRVFPELKVWCERRKLRLVEVDLRWGVTEVDATAHANVVRTCLKRIDACRPFFLSLIGQRYGWIPAKEDIAADTFEEYPGLEDAVEAGLSITEMEICHAVWASFHPPSAVKGHAEQYQPAGYAFFYLRDNDYLDHLPSETTHLRRIYTDEAEGDQQLRCMLRDKLKHLREVIVSETQQTIRCYRGTWDPEARTPEIALPQACPALLDKNVRKWQTVWETTLNAPQKILGRELPPELAGRAQAYNQRLTQGRLTNFECNGQSLSEIILHDLKTAIADRYPAHMAVVARDELQQELDQHEAYLFSKCEGFIERPDDFSELDEYALGESRQLFVVTAGGGIGKSTRLARWIDRSRQRPERFGGATIHFRFIGQSDGSSTVVGLLRTLLLELQRIGKIPLQVTETRQALDGSETSLEIPLEIPSDPRELLGFWWAQLPRLGHASRTVIVIDAINQLESSLRDLSWLPMNGLPKNVKLIVSLRRGEADADAWLAKISTSDQVWLSEVAPFDSESDRRKLVSAYLDQYLKELDSHHIDELISASGAYNPLFLNVVLSELRVFGAFLQLREKIQEAFGETPVSAFQAVLQRLENDPSYTGISPGKAIPLLFALLAHARFGLSVEELSELLVDSLGLAKEKHIEVRDAVNLFLRQVSPFLASREGRYDFFFEAFAIATRQRYVAKDAKDPQARPTQDWHRLLADYFDSQLLYLGEDESRASNRRKLLELPYQLARAQMWDKLQTTLTDLDFLNAKVRTVGVQPLIEDYEGASQAGYEGRDLPLVHDTLRLSAQILTEDRTQLSGQLLGRLLAVKESQLQPLLTQAKAWKEGLWLRPLTSALQPPGGPLLRTFEGHTRWIEDVALTPDGRLAISGSRDQTARVWDLWSGACLHILAGHPDFVTAVALTQDGRYALTGSEDGMRVWDLSSGACTQSFLKEGMKITAIGVSNNNRYAAIGNYYGWVVVYDLTTGQMIFKWPLHKEFIASIRVTSKGRYVYSVSKDNIFGIFDQTRNVSKELRLENGAFLARSISSLGHFVITGAEDGIVRVWESKRGALTHSLEGHEGWVTAVAISQDGRWALSGSADTTLRLWDLKTATCANILEGHSDWVDTVALTPEGRYAVSGAQDNSVRAWDLKRLTRPPRIEKHHQRVTSVAITPDGHYALSASNDGSVRVWDLISGDHLHTLEGHTDFVTAVAMTPDSRHGLSTSLDGTMRMWNIKRGTCVRVYDGRGVPMQSIAVCPGSRLAVSGSHMGQVWLWDLRHKDHGQHLKGHIDRVDALAITPDGVRVISGAWESDLRVWDIKSGKCIHVLEGHLKEVFTVAVSPTGHNAVSGSRDQTARVWDLRSGRCVHTLIGHEDWVTSVAITPDGNHAVTGSGDATVRIWDLHTGMCVHTLLGHRDRINKVLVSPDGRFLISGAEDKTIRVWELISGAPLCAFHAHAQVMDCAISNDCRIIVAGDQDGRVHFLQMEGNFKGAASPTAQGKPKESRKRWLKFWK